MVARWLRRRRPQWTMAAVTSGGARRIGVTAVGLVAAMTGLLALMAVAAYIGLRFLSAGAGELPRDEAMMRSTLDRLSVLEDEIAGLPAPTDAASDDLSAHRGCDADGSDGVVQPRVVREWEVPGDTFAARGEVMHALVLAGWVGPEMVPGSSTARFTYFSSDGWTGEAYLASGSDPDALLILAEVAGAEPCSLAD